MTTVNLNLDDVEEFEPIPQGTYLCRITKAEIVLSKAAQGRGDKKEDMLSSNAEVAEGEHAGRVLFFNTMLRTKSKKTGEMKTNYYLKKLVDEALGVEWTKKGFATEDCMGVELTLVVEPPDPGQRFNKVVDYLPPS